MSLRVLRVRAGTVLLGYAHARARTRAWKG
jgi:hypothetical protein